MIPLSSHRRSSAFRQALILLGLTFFFALGTAFFHPKCPPLQRPAADALEIELAALLAENAKPLWVDARPRTEFDREHIPGAVLLNEQEWSRLLDDFLDRWTPGQAIVVYCGGGSCDASQAVAGRIRKEVGAENVRILKGGWPAWKSQKQ